MTHGDLSIEVRRNVSARAVHVEMEPKTVSLEETAQGVGVDKNGGAWSTPVLSGQRGRPGPEARGSSRGGGGTEVQGKAATAIGFLTFTPAEVSFPWPFHR